MARNQELQQRGNLERFKYELMVDLVSLSSRAERGLGNLAISYAFLGSRGGPCRGAKRLPLPPLPSNTLVHNLTVPLICAVEAKLHLEPEPTISSGCSGRCEFSIMRSWERRVGAVGGTKVLSKLLGSDAVWRSAKDSF